MLFVSCTSVKPTQESVSVIRNSTETDVYTAVSELPVFDGLENLNKNILKTSDEWFKAFSENAQQNTAARINTADNKEPIEIPFCTFDQTWKLVHNSSDYVSLLLKSYSYTGGANGQIQLASFTWDVKNNKEIVLDELFAQFIKPATLEELSAVCRSQLIERLNAHNDPDLVQMIQSGTAAVPENYRVFTVSDDNLTIYFTKYQVAPGSYGVLEVTIPRLK